MVIRSITWPFGNKSGLVLFSWQGIVIISLYAHILYPASCQYRLFTLQWFFSIILALAYFIVIRRLFLIKFSFFLTFLVWFHGFSSSFVILLITHETPAVEVLFSLKQTNHIDTCFLPYGVISRSCIGIIFFLTIEKRRPLDLFSMFLFCILFHKYIFS